MEVIIPYTSRCLFESPVFFTLGWINCTVAPGLTFHLHWQAGSYRHLYATLLEASHLDEFKPPKHTHLPKGTSTSPNFFRFSIANVSSRNIAGTQLVC